MRKVEEYVPLESEEYVPQQSKEKPGRDRTSVINRLAIDPLSSVPPHVQLKDQLKIAYTFGTLKQGDVLPSIRELARELNIGEAVGRRAYKELCELGMLSTQQRKNVRVNHGPVKPQKMERVVTESGEQCDAMLAWAHEHGVSSMSLARLLLQRAMERESTSPSYAYVDSSRRAAVELATILTATWEVKVIGISLSELRELSTEERRRFTSILVHSYRHEECLKVLRKGRSRTFPVRVKPKDFFIQKIRRLPRDSRVLLLYSDEDFRRIGKSSVNNYQDLVGEKCRMEGLPIGSVSDLADLAARGEYRLIIVSVHLWDGLPGQIRRSSRVVRTQNEFDVQSLEEIRISAGIIV